MENLGRDHDLVAGRELSQQSASDLLGDSGRVHVGRVEQVDAKLDRTLHDRPRRVLVEHPRPPLGRTERHHAQRDARDFKATMTEVDVIHRSTT